MLTMSVNKGRLRLAFCITPLLMPGVFLLADLAYYSVMGYNRPEFSWSGALLFSYVFGAPAAYLAMVLMGWPWVMQLTRWRRLLAAYVCLGASVIGAIAFGSLCLLIGAYSTFDSVEIIQKSGVGAGLGLLSGVVFCAFAGIPARTTKG